MFWEIPLVSLLTQAGKFHIKIKSRYILLKFALLTLYSVENICKVEYDIADMLNVRNFTRAGLVISRFYPKARELRQFQNCNKTA